MFEPTSTFMFCNWRRCVAIVLTLAASTIAYAQAPQEIKWDDLAVRLSAAENPFARLTEVQLTLLVDVASARDRKARGAPVSQEEIANERAAAEKLKAAGIDVDALLAKRQEIAEKKRLLATAVNPALDGKLVRLPGYVLPLEFSGKKVTEFLLVPWYGACIHTPPPPPNQIVRVKSDKPFEMNAPFDAVWVTGRIAGATQKTSVYMTDGTAEVDVGYSLRATDIERY